MSFVSINGTSPLRPSSDTTNLSPKIDEPVILKEANRRNFLGVLACASAGVGLQLTGCDVKTNAANDVLAELSLPSSFREALGRIQEAFKASSGPTFRSRAYYAAGSLLSALPVKSVEEGGKVLSLMGVPNFVSESILAASSAVSGIPVESYGTAFFNIYKRIPTFESASILAATAVSTGNSLDDVEQKYYQCVISTNFVTKSIIASAAVISGKRVSEIEDIYKQIGVTDICDAKAVLARAVAISGFSIKLVEDAYSSVDCTNRFVDRAILAEAAVTFAS